MDKLIEMLAKVGFHGTAGLLLLGTLCFVVVFGVIHQPELDVTKAAAQVLFTGAGALIAALILAIKSWGNS